MNTDKPVIAVVDDEKSICKALERLLRSAGMSAKTFCNGADFLCFLETNQPNCLVLDLHMPRMNGFTLLEKLAQAGSRLPVIAITGDDSEETYQRALESGISAFLHKPVDGQLLLETIAAALESGTRTNT